MYGDHQEEQDIGKVFDFNIIKRLFGIIKPYLKYLIIASGFLVIAAGVEVLYPYIVKIAIDELLEMDLITAVGKNTQIKEFGIKWQTIDSYRERYLESLDDEE